MGLEVALDGYGFLNFRPLKKRDVDAVADGTDPSPW
jgi:hypothetical protein